MYFLDKSSSSNFNFLDFPLLVWNWPNSLCDFWNQELVFVKTLHHFVYDILAWNISVKCKWNFLQTLIQGQKILNLLFQHTFFLMFPHFQKYLNPQVRTNKLVNSVVYHLCLSILASGIHPYFFKLLRVLSLSRMPVQFSLTCIFHHVWEKILIYGAHIRKWIESMHFYSWPSSPLKTPGTTFWKSVSHKGQEQRGGVNNDLLY